MYGRTRVLDTYTPIMGYAGRGICGRLGVMLWLWEYAMESKG